MMMDTKKINKNVWRKSLWFLPVIALFAIGTALVNGQNNSENEKTNAKTIALTANQQNEASIFDVLRNRYKREGRMILCYDQFLSGKMAEQTELVMAFKDGKKNDIDEILHFFPETKNADALAFDPAHFTSYPSDSERFTEMLNKELKSRKKVSDTEQLWGRFYSVKNNPNSPLILNVGYTEKLKDDKSEATRLIKDVVGKTKTAFFEPVKSKIYKTKKTTNTSIDYQQNEASIFDVFKTRFKSKNKYSLGKFRFLSGKMSDNTKWIVPLKEGKENDMDMILHFFPETKNADYLAFDPAHFTSYPSDNERFTEMLNKELKSRKKVSDTEQLWGRFYSVKNNPNSPLILNVGYTEKLKNDKSEATRLIK